MQYDSDPAPALPSVGPRDFVHKLNNLLTVVLGQAESSLESGDPEEMRQALRIILQTSTAIADATRAFAKSNAALGSASRNPRRVDDA